MTETFAALLFAPALADFVFQSGWMVANRRRPAAMLADQAAHLVSVATLAVLVPGLWAGGLWAGRPLLSPVLAIAAGLILTVRAGGFAVGFLMEPWADALPPGLTNGGAPSGRSNAG